MQKMVTVMTKQVKDLGGLYVELRKQAFDVMNVGSDQAGTYVYLSAGEAKDPTPFVEEWADKPAPMPTKGEVRRRKEQIEKIGPFKAAPVSVMLPHNAEPSAVSVETEDTSASESSSDQKEKSGFLKSLMRKLFS